jgi:hypothetical protein
MVVDDRHVGWASLGPSEADSELVVDPNAVLSLSVSSERLQAISGGDPQVSQHVGLVQLVQTPSGDGPEIRRTGLCGGL